MPITPGTLIVVGGPTASGKTHVAASIAKHYGTEVISADSRQFYRAMRIGTARPSEDDLLGVEHHFLGHLELEQTWSAGEFARAAEPLMQQLLATKGTAVLTGGSGLYIDALCNGLDPLPLGDPKVRTELQERLERDGLHALTEQLKTLDHAHWTTMDRKNPHRVIRALEVCLVSGEPFSAQRKSSGSRADLHIVRLAIDLPRAELYQRINSRVDRMFADGFIDEARSLLPYRDLNALRTLGYNELFAHFDGMMDLPTTVVLIKQHTRNYAKRQLTWLRRDPSWAWTAPEIPAMIRTLDARH